MEQNGTVFDWTEPREEAALLVAEDKLSDEQIAERLSIGRTTLHRWKTAPEFAARVAEHRALWLVELKRRGIADRQNRVDELNRRWDLMKQVIAARGDDPSMEAIPGGRTGLLVRQVKLVKVYDTDHGVKGEDGVLVPTKLVEMVEEFAVDTGLLKELRDHEKQAAQELGQWTEKQDVTSGGKPITAWVDLARNAVEKPGADGSSPGPD